MCATVVKREKEAQNVCGLQRLEEELAQLEQDHMEKTRLREENTRIYTVRVERQFRIADACLEFRP